jgi:hypothetical protein
MPAESVPGERALRVEAARAEVTVPEYLGRLDQGLLYCYRCGDWHDAGAFGRDRRRPSGRAGSCLRSVREARQASIRRALPSAAAQPAPFAEWIVKRRAPSPGTDGGETGMYWCGPGGSAAADRRGTWSPALNDRVARFPAITEACAALTVAFGGPGTVPAGCRLARLA